MYHISETNSRRSLNKKTVKKNDQQKFARNICQVPNFTTTEQNRYDRVDKWIFIEKFAIQVEQNTGHGVRAGGEADLSRLRFDRAEFDRLCLIQKGEAYLLE